MRSVGEPAEMPDSVSVIGGAPDDEPQPMHYFDSRGVKRMFLTTVQDSTWTIWRAPGEDWNGPDGPGFNQRFIGEISADGNTITGRWERGTGDSGDQWELDFPFTYGRSADRRRIMDDDPRDRLVERIEVTRERWRRLVAEVGEDRMELPGAMGEWTFKDVASHLGAWRRRTIERLEAAGRGEPAPAPPWASDLGDRDVEDDPINDWIHERTKDLPVSEALVEVDGGYDAFIAAVKALPVDDAIDPARFDWLEGVALVDIDPGGHLDTHEPDVRRWLASAPASRRGPC
jgi:hypothetical protein